MSMASLTPLCFVHNSLHTPAFCIYHFQLSQLLLIQVSTCHLCITIRETCHKLHLSGNDWSPGYLKQSCTSFPKSRCRTVTRTQHKFCKPTSCPYRHSVLVDIALDAQGNELKFVGYSSTSIMRIALITCEDNSDSLYVTLTRLYR